MAGPLLARILPMSVRLSFRERSFRFAIAILGLYRTIRRSTDCPRHMANQIARAGTAIGANLEEAKSAYSRRELAQKNSIALREARECDYWLRLLQVDQPQLETVVAPLLSECGQLIAMLATAVRKLRTTPPET